MLQSHGTGRVANHREICFCCSIDKRIVLWNGELEIYLDIVVSNRPVRSYDLFCNDLRIWVDFPFILPTVENRTGRVDPRANELAGFNHLTPLHMIWTPVHASYSGNTVR